MLTPEPCHRATAHSRSHMYDMMDPRTRRLRRDLTCASHCLELLHEGTRKAESVGNLD